MFITASSSISHQPSFRNKGYSSFITHLNETSKLKEPNFSSYIPAMDLRRMSEVLKTSITCAFDCIENVSGRKPEAIVVGTSMGCSIHTKNFLNSIQSAGDGPLSPTSFIVSPHNTIAGQLSLLMKNHAYNMTHTQSTLSFEMALTDAMLCIKNGCKTVLVGGADEEEIDLYNYMKSLTKTDIHITSGAAFFVLEAETNLPSGIRLADVGVYVFAKDLRIQIENFLSTNNTRPDEIQRILYSGFQTGIADTLSQVFCHKEITDYIQFSGTFFTASAFALHLAIDFLQNQKAPKNRVEKILICNNISPENIGLILIEHKPDTATICTNGEAE